MADGGWKPQEQRVGVAGVLIALAIVDLLRAFVVRVRVGLWLV